MCIHPPLRLRGIEKPVIFFDGACNFCNFWVRFIINRDPDGRFYFASLQSVTGQELLRTIRLPPHESPSMILFDKDEYFIKSSAVFHIAKRMGGFWRLGYAFIIVPITNFRFVASFRLKLYTFRTYKKHTWTPNHD